MRDYLLRVTTLVCTLALATTGAVSAEAVIERDSTGKGYLGATLAGFSGVEGPDGPMHDGVYVVGLNANLAAAAAGLKKGDRLVSIDGQPIQTLDEVGRILARARPGETIRVAVQRGALERDYPVVLGKRPGLTLDLGSSKGARQSYIVERNATALGARAMTPGRQLADFLGVEAGALITEVREDSPAWLADLRAGDVVIAWNGWPIAGKADLDQRLEDAEPGDVVDLTVSRRDRLETVSVVLAPAEEESGLSLTIGLTDISVDLP